jgi:hypothetical protein
MRALQAKDTNYAQALRAFIDVLPDSAWILLLGFARDAAETPSSGVCQSPWYSAAVERVHKIEKMMKLVRFRRKEMQSVCCRYKLAATKSASNSRGRPCIRLL